MIVFLGLLSLFMFLIGVTIVCRISNGKPIGLIALILLLFSFVLFIECISKETPTAIDVYRGNTTLEITSINGVSTDTVVIFKKK